MSDTIYITKEVLPDREGHCQLHGDPYFIPSSSRVRYLLPSGKCKSFQIKMDATLFEIINYIKGHPRNLKGYHYKAVSAQEFELLMQTLNTPNP